VEGIIRRHKTFVFIYHTGGGMTEGASSNDESIVLGEIGNLM
jgi:hypothetical protein